MQEPSEEFDHICTWMGSQTQFVTGSPFWIQELRGRILVAKRALSDSELDSLNHTAKVMERESRDFAP